MDKGAITKMKLTLLWMLIILTASGCSTFKFGADEPKGAVLVNQIRGAEPNNLEVQEISFTSASLKEAVAHPGTSRMRLVQITRAGNSQTLPEYRIFDVKPMSAPYVIGIRDADILVAAHGYAVFSPQQFGKYLGILPYQESGSIEIRREGQPILFKIMITK